MFQRSLIAGVALAAVVAMPAAAQQKITLKLSHFLPPVHGIHTDFIEPWAEDLNQCTDGQVEVMLAAADCSYRRLSVCEERAPARQPVSAPPPPQAPHTVVRENLAMNGDL